MAGRPANRLNQGALSPQKAFLIGVKNRHQRHLGQIKAFPQQIHPHQHVVLAIAQVLDDFDPLNRVDLGVQVTHPYPILGQIVGEIFGHALGERGDDHPLVFVGPDADLTQQIIHLAFRGAHFHDRIEHPGGPNHLLHHLAVALLQLPVAWGRTHKDGLGGLLPELRPF